MLKIWMLILLSCGQLFAGVEGYQGLNNIGHDFSYRSSAVNAGILKDYILGKIEDAAAKKVLDHHLSTPDERKAEAKRLANLAIIISSAFKIDTIYFVSMIERESHFQYKAVSPTNAVGLTQLVRPAMLEIFQQLGFQAGGDVLAQQELQDSYQKVYNALANTADKLPTLDELKVYNPANYQNLKTLKTMILDSRALGMTLGAAYLKVLLSHFCRKDTCDKYFGYARAGDANGADVAVSTYKWTFIGYNGDTSPITKCSYSSNLRSMEVRYCYARAVLSVGNKIFNFAKQAIAKAPQPFMPILNLSEVVVSSPRN